MPKKTAECFKHARMNIDVAADCLREAATHPAEDHDVPLDPEDPIPDRAYVGFQLQAEFMALIRSFLAKE